jgi:F-type H+-transporting ATPase subunit a
MILASNLLMLVPVPLLNVPPTSYFSVPLALALVAVLGSFALAARMSGAASAVLHLFWPNPLQLVEKGSQTLSLSLRLYGNIGGEFIVMSLATQAAPYGIPLIIHALGLVPATVQPLVFTLLTVNFLEIGTSRSAGRAEKPRNVAAPDVGIDTPEVIARAT